MASSTVDSGILSQGPGTPVPRNSRPLEVGLEFNVNGTDDVMTQTAFFTKYDMESRVWMPRPDVPDVPDVPKKQEPTKLIEKVDTSSFDFRVLLWSIPVEKRNTILRNVGISCDNTLWLDSLANYCAIHGTVCIGL